MNHSGINYFTLISIVGLLLLPLYTLAKEGASHSKSDYNNVEIKSFHLNNGIYMVTGKGGNIGLCIGQDGVFMIDDQFAPLSDKITNVIKALSKKPVRFLINTHWHADHTGGNEKFSNFDTLIVAHDNVRERLKSGQFIKAFNKHIPPYPDNALPVVTFDQSMTFHYNNEKIKVIHFPNAHTDGDCMILFRNANVLHTGDIFFNGIYPFIDESSNGSIGGIIAAIDHIIPFINKSTKIIPGHGPLGDFADLISYQKMLKTVQVRIRLGIKNGQSLKQIISQKPLSDLNEKWGGGFLSEERFIGIVYSLMKVNDR